MSSHREAPEMAKDPVADSTDVYAFVSPDRPDTVTLIANYIPFQAPDGGPNFYEFGDDVAYDINISNRGKGEADITYRFHFHTKIRDPKTFLYNTGPDHQASTAPAGTGRSSTRSPGSRAARPRCSPSTSPARRSTSARAAPRTTRTLAAQAVHKIGKRRVFAGQRADAFHVDLGQHLRPRARCGRSSTCT